MMHQIPYTLAGIPCLIQVTRHFVKNPDMRADNPDDYFGYTENEYEILDRKGYPAAWLEKKITRSIEDDINEKINEYMDGYYE